MDSRYHSPRLFPRPLSLHPPVSVRAHLDGWLSLISRGNSSPAAASSSCISTSALTDSQTLELGMEHEKSAGPNLPPSAGRCLNHPKGERCLFFTPKPLSFFLFPLLLIHSYFQTAACTWFSWRLSHQDHIWINLVPGQTLQLRTFIP